MTAQRDARAGTWQELRRTELRVGVPAAEPPGQAGALCVVGPPEPCVGCRNENMSEAACDAAPSAGPAVAARSPSVCSRRAPREHRTQDTAGVQSAKRNFPCSLTSF